MPKIAYIEKKFRNETLTIIAHANQILDDYAAQGYDLTLRQLYYQFISRDLLPESYIDKSTGTKNNQKSYDRLGAVISDARMAGLIDWNRIVDRTRNLEGLGHWDTPADIMRSAMHSYRIDKWERQDYRPEVWIEKDALRGVVTRVCNQYDVPHFSCRGYSSQSEMWRAAQRMISYMRDGKTPYIIHLGDHDPSGIDMSRDIIDRLQEFVEYHEPGGAFRVKRIALNWDQVQQYSPPPNPAKMTDSRVHDYIAKFGDESWELDALEPTVISNLIANTIIKLTDSKIWEEDHEREAKEKNEVKSISDNYHSCIQFLNGR